MLSSDMRRVTPSSLPLPLLLLRHQEQELTPLPALLDHWQMPMNYYTMLLSMTRLVGMVKGQPVPSGTRRRRFRRSWGRCDMVGRIKSVFQCARLAHPTRKRSLFRSFFSTSQTNNNHGAIGKQVHTSHQSLSREEAISSSWWT